MKSGIYQVNVKKEYVSVDDVDGVGPKLLSKQAIKQNVLIFGFFKKLTHFLNVSKKLKTWLYQHGNFVAFSHVLSLKTYF